MKCLTKLAAVLWAAPATSLGLALGLIGLLGKGRVRRNGLTLEFWGGLVAVMLRCMPVAGGASAMTLGHVILGSDLNALQGARRHELVHVHQYERWGALLIPAYLLCGAWLWLRGRDWYHDNPFERQAYRSAEL
jgi:hypothetical protein